MKKSLLTMAAALALVSCSQEDLMKGHENRPTGAIGAKVFVPTVTRGTALNSPDDLGAIGNGFDLYAVRMDNGELFMGADDGSSNYVGVPFISSETEGTYVWDYENESQMRFWSEAENAALKFYAVSPKNDKTAGSLNKNVSSENMALDYTVPTDCSQQVDLMYAVTGNLSSTEGTHLEEGIDLQFRHALSQIVFKAKTESELVFADVKEVTICNVYQTASFDVVAFEAYLDADDKNAATFPWGSYTTPEEFTAQLGDNLPTGINTQYDDEGNEESTSCTDGNNYGDGRLTDSNEALLLIPQNLADNNATLRIVCSVSFLRGDEPTPIFEDKTFEVPVTTDWQPGYKYTYTLIFSADMANPIKVKSVEVPAWIEGEDTDVKVEGESSENNEPTTSYELIPTNLVSDGTNILIRDKDELIEARELSNNVAFYYIGTESEGDTYPVYSIEEADEDDEDGGIPAPEGVSTENWPLEITFASASYKQTADIDLTDESWIPMLVGSYDGDNHTISNLTVDNKTLTDGGYDEQGDTFGSMFYLADNDGGITSIKNLKMTNVKIGTEEDPVTYAAAIVARVNFYGESIEISNCSVSGNSAIYGIDRAAGIITCGGGTPELSITNCTNHAAVNSNSIAGGITATDSDVKNSNNHGDVTVNSNSGHAAGIVPFTRSYYTIQNCHNYGNITAGIAGGIVAEIQGCNITYSHNEGTISVTDNTDTYYPGGIVGYAHPIQEGEDIAITGCYNVKSDVSLVGSIRHAHGHEGEITNIAITLTSCYNVPTNNSTCAMIGNIYQGTDEEVICNFTLTITNCYYTVANQAYIIAENSQSNATVPESNSCIKLDAGDPEYSEYYWPGDPMEKMNSELSHYQYENNNDENSHPLKLSGEPTE